MSLLLMVMMMMTLMLLDPADCWMVFMLIAANGMKDLQERHQMKLVFIILILILFLTLFF